MNKVINLNKYLSKYLNPQIIVEFQFENIKSLTQTQNNRQKSPTLPLPGNSGVALKSCDFFSSFFFCCAERISQLPEFQRVCSQAGISQALEAPPSFPRAPQQSPGRSRAGAPGVKGTELVKIFSPRLAELFVVLQGLSHSGGEDVRAVPEPGSDWHRQ